MSENHRDDDKTQTHVPLLKDTTVGHYRIVEKIGAGGMGEVYLAEDTELDRKVALKFLPVHLCQDEDCRKRFKREAQAAAKLDHPNIVTVYEVGEHNGRPYFAMAHVEGQSLKGFSSGKDLSAEQIFELGIQICEGLQAAHDKGITHRDIKPSNILIDSHGRARIVDFGLASVIGKDQLTKTGSTLGTIGYMSPEQVRGQEIDHRTDLFSLGVVLYELITKQNPFKRDSEAATLKAVSDDVAHPIARYRSGMPDSLQAILDKVLDKDRDTRYQHADELRADLSRTLQEISGQITAISPHRSRTGIFVYIVLATIIVTVGIITIVILFKGEERRAVVPKMKKITHTGDVRQFALTRDGSMVAYSRKLADGSHKVYLSDSDGDNVLEVFDLARDTLNSLWWIPGGKKILLDVSDNVGRVIYIISRVGGVQRRFGFIQGGGGALSPDGTQFVTMTDENRLLYLNLNSGDTSSAPVGRELDYPVITDWSPAGDQILLEGRTAEDGYGLYSVGSDGNNLFLLDNAYQYTCWSSDGKVLYVIEFGGETQQVLRLDVDSKTGAVKGEPEVLLTGMRTLGIDVSLNSQKLLIMQNSSTMNLWKVLLDQGEDIPLTQLEQITSQTSFCFNPRISPDGGVIAYTVIHDSANIYTIPKDGGVPQQVTHTSLIDMVMDWSPDGKQIAFVQLKDITLSNVTLKTIDIEGGMPVTLTEPPFWGDCREALQLSWSSDDRLISANEDCSCLWIYNSRTGEVEQAPKLESKGKMHIPYVSPKSDQVAVYWDREGDQGDGVWTISLEDYSETLVARLDARVFGWGPEGDWIYVWRQIESDIGKEIGRVNVNSQSVQWLAVIDRETNPNPGWIDLSPDGTWAVFADWQARADLWIVENFDPYVE